MSFGEEPKSEGTHNGAQHNAIENGTNGAQVNGHQRHSASAGRDDKPSKASRKTPKGETWSLSHYRQASRRPLPTETGDGSYRVLLKRPGLVQDLRSIGWAGT